MKTQGRQLAGFVAYGIGALLVLLALPGDVITAAEPGMALGDDEDSMGEIMWMFCGMLIRQPREFVPNSLGEFIEGPLPALMMLLSFALILPGGFLMFLASRHAGFGWLGRVLWLLVLVGGPFCLLLVLGDDNYYRPGGGVWCWFFGCLTVASSHWIMAPRQLDSGPMEPPVPGPPPS